MTTVSFFVPGVPRPQPRARSFVLRGKGGRPIMTPAGQPILRVHESGTAEHWKGQIAQVAKEFVPMPPMQGPVRVDIDFYFPRPATHFRSNGQLKDSAPFWFTNKREDRDNLDKAVLDTLTVLGMWQNDGQVCDGRIRRIFCHSNKIPGLPGAHITIEQLSQPIRERKAEPKELRLETA